MSSYLVCAVSQKPVEVPVVSSKSGLVFEKGTIEKYIDINGCCPITGEKLEYSDLIPIKSTILSPSQQEAARYHRTREDFGS